jgi:electron-transferring-flavoprotein dehydrogenase
MEWPVLGFVMRTLLTLAAPAFKADRHYRVVKPRLLVFTCSGMIAACRRRWSGTMSERESMPYDVVIVGGGPAGLAASIRLKQANPEISVCLLEKGSEIGAHILSGAVVDPRALDELLPEWRTMDCPMAQVPVTDNWHWVLTKAKKYAIPHWPMPPFMSNDGNYTGSLGNRAAGWPSRRPNWAWKSSPASGAEVLFNEGAVIGVATGDMGVAKDGSHKPDYQPGMELHAKYTLFAEGRAAA